MSRLAENLSIAADTFGVSQNRLGPESGTSQSTVNRIIQGDTKAPKADSLQKLARYFGVTMDALQNAEEQEFRNIIEAARRKKRGVAEPIAAYEVRAVEGDSDVDPDREVLVDEVDVVVSGGPGAWVPEFVETKFRMPFQLYWFREKRAKPADTRIMRVRGSSMERTLFHGDKVVVNFGDREVQDDHVFVLYYGGGVKVKRLFRMADGRLRVVSDNIDKDTYPDEFVGQGDLENVYVLGRVIDKSGSGGL